MRLCADFDTVIAKMPNSSVEQSAPAICIATPEYPPQFGGVGVSVQRIARYITATGLRVHVVVCPHLVPAEHGRYRRADVTSEMGEDGVTLHRIALSFRSSESRRRDRLMDVAIQLQRLHSRFDFAAFHGFDARATGLLVSAVGGDFGRPVIVSCRGSDLDCHAIDPSEVSGICRGLEAATVCTFVSHASMRRACTLAPDVRQKAVVILNSYDVARIGPDRGPTSRETIVIGTSGRLRCKKGAEYLVDAVSKLVASDMRARLVIIGGNDAREDGYWREILTDGVTAGWLTVTGFLNRDEALEQLNELDIYVQPSVQDGCPNALLEAMANGLACVGTSVGAIPEVLRDGIDGLIVPPADGDAILQAICTLRDDGVRASFGRAAKQRVCADLSPTIELELWRSVYEGIGIAGSR